MHYALQIHLVITPRNVMSGFNEKMQQLRYAYQEVGIKKDMKKYWNRYQIKRMKDTYFPQYIKCKNCKNFLNVCIELVRLYIQWGCFPYHYFRYRLYHKYFSYKTIRNYLPETIFYYNILPKLNRELILLDDKKLCYDILSYHNIPTPHLYFYITNSIVYTSSHIAITTETEFIDYLLQIRTKNVIVGKKNLCGSGGHDILFFNLDNGIIKLGLQQLSLKELCRQYDGWIFQEKLQNSPVIDELYSHSLNSFRLMTYMRGAKVEVLYAMLKLGNNYKPTDNAHTGGMYIKVNINSGMLSSISYDEEFNEYIKHPISNIEFRNKSIPCFRQVIDTARKAAKAFPYLRFIGWDIALTDAGPVVLEGNSSPGLTIIQRTHNGMEKFLETYYEDSNSRKR